ncbi:MULTISPECIES: SulP family inorganic anion transporter [Methylobacteriaceae]|jgi:SulP family sulfate permease|uniref:Transporter, SulP family n=1 Tax=Methylorubrum extorquens (strain DSM 6343 / CIP 106787 / DM4) TaxID=661410 RepID=C7CFK8_METED|nr:MULTISPECIES: SulP family inorganic anion transporter [Methylobacteriaceae]AWV19924.1 sulfate permease [Methylobacterium sp. XJLW]AYO86583.1 SulP family inorganic anion transporter [Methylobacterium brachiatum]CAX26142.1 putative transporter, SulP family [Methylorubrum extorquens DM4]
MPNGAATAHLYKPKLVTVLAEGYGVAVLRRDVMAGLTVAIVALPLSMAIAVASGVSPDRGLYAAIVGGFVVSALGGSRFQIGGPAGAFIVLVSATVARFGVDGTLLAVLLSGLLLTLVGAFRLGSLIRHIPHAVTVGFTAGIACTILASQLKELGGLKLDGAEPGPVIPKLVAIVRALPTLNPTALALGCGVVLAVFALRQWKPSFPGMLVSVAAASALAWLGGLDVATVGNSFGSLPHGLPMPQLPPMTPQLLRDVFPTALAFTLLGGIESLLSAKVADSMTDRVHRSNMELIAQGIANVASALFGGISVTGTIARTATNVRAGAASPIAGILHSAFLLLFMLVATPLAGFVPLAALAAVLLVVSWNMVEKSEFVRLLKNRCTAAVLLATFGLTLLEDLTAGIIAGCVLAAVLAVMHRGVPEEGA